MKNHSKFIMAAQIFLGSSFLLIGMLYFKISLTYDGLENNYLADNWGTPLVIFLILLFGLGWWFEYFLEHRASTKGPKLAGVAFFCIVLVSALLLSISFFPSVIGFLRFSIGASGYILMSGFFFRLSTIHPDVIAKLRERS